MMKRYLKGLNDEQRRAVKYGVTAESPINKRPLLVLAGAGSGKTKVIAHRVAHVVIRGIDPQRVLLLTFTKRAAQEMIRRVERIATAALKTEQLNLPWAGTFHSIGTRLLREYARRIGLGPSFTIHDRSDSEDMINWLRHDLGFSETESRFPLKSTCLGIYSRQANSGDPLREVLAKRFPLHVEYEKELRKLFRRYDKAKARQNILDFDDLLLFWAEMLEDGSIATELNDRFDHVLVDEYQDTNSLQAKILVRLKPDGRGVTVVGDDAQAIYSFRAADVRNIIEFPEQFARRAKIITLERNYRSNQPILDACNAIIGLANGTPYKKNLYSDRISAQKPLLTSVQDEATQARYVALKVLEAREAGVPLKQQAVLFRASHHSAQLEIELARRNIPFIKYGGIKFLESKHVKDVVGVLKWAENKRDQVAGFRTVQLLPGIGPVHARRILDATVGQRDLSKALRRIEVPKNAAAYWPDFADVIAQLRKERLEWPAEFHAVRLWYEPLLRNEDDDAGSRLADLLQMEEIAAAFQSRQQFLTELALDPPDGTNGRNRPRLNDDEDCLTLSTIHSAKGREWKIVRILSVVDGCIPSDRALGTAEEIEEERRVLYVATSRPKDELDLVVPLRFYTYQQDKLGDSYSYATPSQFIPKSIHGCFEKRTWQESKGHSRTHVQQQGRTIDVAARLRRKWD